MHYCIARAHTYDLFQQKCHFKCRFNIYFSQFSQLLQCSCSAFGFLLLQCTAFACLHFVLLIWGCFIKLSSSFLILISLSKLFAAPPVQSHPQTLDAFSNSVRVIAETIECTEAQERLLHTVEWNFKWNLKHVLSLGCMIKSYFFR